MECVGTLSGCILSPRGPCDAQRMWDVGSSQCYRGRFQIENCFTGCSSRSWAELGSLGYLAGPGSLPRASQCQPCCRGRESSPGAPARQEQLFLL